MSSMKEHVGGVVLLLLANNFGIIIVKSAHINYGPSPYYDGVPSMEIYESHEPCRAHVLIDQDNYICAHDRIWCLPGWKVCNLFIYL
jgi:hypothetical protein